MSPINPFQSHQPNHDRSVRYESSEEELRKGVALDRFNIISATSVNLESNINNVYENDRQPTPGQVSPEVLLAYRNRLEEHAHVAGAVGVHAAEAEEATPAVAEVTTLVGYSKTAEQLARRSEDTLDEFFRGIAA